MNRLSRFFSGLPWWVAGLLAVACSGSGSSSHTENPSDTTVQSLEVEVSTSTTDPHSAVTGSEYIYEEGWQGLTYLQIRDSLPPFDLQQDLQGKTLSQLRILRNTIPARYGYLFMKADLRDYFDHTYWYRPLMEARWYGQCAYSGLKPAPAIAYTAAEEAFLDRVKAEEEKRLQKNFIVKNGKRYPNVQNMVNLGQYQALPDAFRDKLAYHALAIVPNNNIQFFHLYEQNDYSQAQNFVTSDALLQLFHMHFSFMLRGFEEETFVPLLQELTIAMVDGSQFELAQATDEKIKDYALFSAAMYAVPYTILTNNMPAMTGRYKEMVSLEVAAIREQRAQPSMLLKAYEQVNFPYDMFKPRGHYTRSDTLQRYFNAMQWLQLASYCLDDDEDLGHAIFDAYVLNGARTRENKPVKDLYKKLLEPTTFLIGAPDNVSVLDVCGVLANKGDAKLTTLLTPQGIATIRQELQLIAQKKNAIQPEKAVTCPDKINFMPARYVPDNEILQAMTKAGKREYPKGLDVMAALGSEAAEDLLLDFYNENRVWADFTQQLNKMKAKFQNASWDETVYAKWLQCLKVMLEPDAQYPYFMQLDSWGRKNLNTALASWTELKHDAVLYAEQPMASECGGGGDCDPPPNPYVVGYVEPNIKLWKNMKELLALNDVMLATYDLGSNRLKYRQTQLAELCDFLLQVSEKEIKGEELSEQEYRTIEIIGSDLERLTLSIVEAERWEDVSGPDKEVAVVADVYTNNRESDQAGILHEGVGHVNDLYVVVEIGGYLYLTKGATFSYYEFPRPLNDRMTDEEWQDMLKQGKVYPVPAWMEEIMIDLKPDRKPAIQEYLYSSGC